jgi:hypothetical protein
MREHAVLAAQRRQVRDGRERDQVEVPEQRVAVAAQRATSASHSLNATPAPASPFSGYAQSGRFGLTTAHRGGSTSPGV